MATNDNERDDRTYPIRVTTEIPLTVAMAAQWFAGLDDDAQARFFVEVARVAQTWTGGLGPLHQWFQIGSHLKNCECSTPEAREMIETVMEGMRNGKH